MRRRLGCLSASGTIAAVTTMVLVLIVGLLVGGRLFSPGPLNAQAGGATLGGVFSHAETGGRCSACHAAFWGGETMADRCLACHVEIGVQLQDPGSLHGALMSGGDGPPCQDCHTEHHGAESVLTIIDPETFPHGATGYALQGHQQQPDGQVFSCSDCHGPDLAHFDPATCLDCHVELDSSYMEAHVDAFGTSCLGCHDGLDTYGQQFDHGRTAFPLVGRHVPLTCAECHLDARSPVDLEAAPQDCFTCHELDDAHDRQFGQTCGQCHTPEGWEQATFDHNQTEFALVGRHQEVDCRDCHVGNVYQGTPQDCFSCHERDGAHGGQFGQNCGQCHIPDDWDQTTFDHNLAAFALVGRHQEVDCRDCHVGNVYQGTRQDCFSCHETDDAHGGQFGLTCAECHSPESWEQATFDHSLAAFVLTGAHVRVDRLDCHLGGIFEGTPSACVDCHEEPIFHLGLLGTACADCHSTDTWTPARFDRSHTFPINHGEGGPSPCRTCHPDQLATFTCYGCHEHDPAGIEEEHRKEEIIDFQDCMQCHPTGQKEEGDNGD